MDLYRFKAKKVKSLYCLLYLMRLKDLSTICWSNRKAGHRVDRCQRSATSIKPISKPMSRSIRVLKIARQ